MTLYNIIKTLSDTNSILEKESILYKNKDNDILKKFFHYALDKKYNYGFKRFELFSIPSNTSSGYEFIFTCLDRLIQNKKGLKKFIPEVTAMMSPEEQDIFMRILKKDPGCGVSMGLTKRIWKDDVSDNQAKLCKAVPFSKKNIKKISFPAYAQLKADGTRCIIIVDNENIRMLTGNGNSFFGLNTLKNDIEKIINNGYKSFVLDGEMIYKENDKISDRTKGNGILSKSIKNTITDEEESGVCLVAWDFIDFESYINDSNQEKYSDRLEKLTSLINNNNLKNIFIIESKIVNNIDETIEYFEELRNRDEEGIILKNMNFFWKNKRIPDCVKFKLEISNTLRVIDSISGKKGTKYEKYLGAIICESEDKKVYVNVGSGFSDEQRKEFWENRLDGMYVEIISNGIIKDKKTGEYSLFLPRFKEVRYDKNEADTLETIIELSKGSSLLE